MIKKNKQSVFNNAENVGIKRKILLGLGDYFLIFVLTIFFYIISDCIGNQTFLYKNTTSTLSKTRQDLTALIVDSKLSKLSDGFLESVDEVTNTYLKATTLKALKDENIENLSESIYKDVKEISPEEDNSYYYFVNFKKDNLDKFNADDTYLNNYGKDYYVNSLIELTGEDFFKSGDYPYLTLEKAKEINEYFLNNDYSKGKTSYDTLKNAYKTILKKGVDEFQTYNIEYLKKISEFNALSNVIYEYRIVIFFIAYIISVLINFLVFPLIFKNNETLTGKIMKIASINNKGTKFCWYNYVLKVILMSIFYSSIVFFVTILLFGTDGIPLLMHSILGFINMFYLCILSIIIILTNLIFGLANKKSLKNIFEISTLTVYKEKYEFIVDNKDKEKEDGETIRIK